MTFKQTRRSKTNNKTNNKTKKASSKRLQAISFYKKPPQITEIDGLQFLLLPIKCNTIRVECKLFGGNYLETRENAGISHVLEHILTNAWKKCYKNHCSLYLEKYGTISNAHTTYMNTHYWIQGLSKFKNVLLTYILSIILQPHLIEKTMIAEIEAVRNELANYINHPDYNLQDIATKTIYKISGLQFYSDYKLQLSNLKNFTIKQLITFSQEIVYTGRLLFVVSGSFEKTPMCTLIQKTLTGINHRINPSMGIYFHNATMTSCYDIKKRVVFIKNTQSKNATILLTFPIDIYFGDKDLDILRITTSILGSGLNSLLMKKLRLHKNMIYGLSVSTKTDFCGTLLSIKISTMHKHVKDVISMTVGILKKYSRTTITEIMLKHYKLRHILELQSVCLNTPAAVSNYYMDQFFYQLGKKHKRILTLQEKTSIINKVNVKTIRAMFKKLFDMHRVSIFYMSEKKIGFDIKDI